MKKSLFALAATTAFAGAAQAQSSVTVYGILDMGYVGSNAIEVAAPTAANAGNTVRNQQTTKVQKNGFGNGAEQTSRLGFKGTEDLGGGASAFFTVELGLTPQNSELSGGTAKDAVQNNMNASGSAVDNRQSFVGVKKNGLGQFAFGRQYTPIFNAAAATDPGQLNNVAGNLVYNSGSVYASSDTLTSGTNNNIGFTNRSSNTLTAKSDNFAGFSASASYALNNQNQTVLTNSSAGGGNTNWNGWGLSADYSWQKLYLTVAYQSFKTQYSSSIWGSTAGTAVNLNSAGITAPQLTAGGNVAFAPAMISDKQTYVAGTYDFGILKAYAQWSGRKVQNDQTVAAITGSTNSIASAVAGQQMNRTAQQLGVRSYITPTIEAWGSIGTGKYTGPIASTGLPASVNVFGYQLGSNYYLSKRTNLYAIYGQQQPTSGSGSTAGSGSSANQYALGLRHTF